MQKWHLLDDLSLAYRREPGVELSSRPSAALTDLSHIYWKIYGKQKTAQMKAFMKKVLLDKSKAGASCNKRL